MLSKRLLLGTLLVWGVSFLSLASAATLSEVWQALIDAYTGSSSELAGLFNASSGSGTFNATDLTVPRQIVVDGVSIDVELGALATVALLTPNSDTTQGCLKSWLQQSHEGLEDGCGGWIEVVSTEASNQGNGTYNGIITIRSSYRFSSVVPLVWHESLCSTLQAWGSVGNYPNSGAAVSAAQSYGGTLGGSLGPKIRQCNSFAHAFALSASSGENATLLGMATASSNAEDPENYFTFSQTISYDPNDPSDPNGDGTTVIVDAGDCETGWILTQRVCQIWTFISHDAWVPQTDWGAEFSGLADDYPNKIPFGLSAWVPTEILNPFGDWSAMVGSDIPQGGICNMASIQPITDDLANYLPNGAFNPPALGVDICDNPIALKMHEWGRPLLTVFASLLAVFAIFKSVVKA